MAGTLRQEVHGRGLAFKAWVTPYDNLTDGYWHLLATIVAVDAKRRKVCMLHAARDFARGIRAFLRLSLAHVTKSIPLALILKSERGTHFAGWSGRLVQSVDFH